MGQFCFFLKHVLPNSIRFSHAQLQWDIKFRSEAKLNELSFKLKTLESLSKRKTKGFFHDKNRHLLTHMVNLRTNIILRLDLIYTTDQS